MERLGSVRARWIGLGLIALVYLSQRSQFISFHDSVSFLEDALRGFNPATNATSHFLYNNIQHILVRFFEFVDPVLVLTLFTVFCSLSSLFLLGRMANAVGGKAAGWSVMVLMGLSFTWWQQSEIVEVYAFNSMVFLAGFACMGADLWEGRRSRMIWAGLFLGLGFLTHIQHILTIPFFLYYLVTGEAAWQRRIAGLLIPLSCFALLFILPSFTDTNDFSAVFFDRQFQSNVLGVTIGGLLKGVALSLYYLVYNFHVFLVPLFIGWLGFWKKYPHLRWAAILLLGPYLAFGVKYNVDDNYVFFLTPYLILLVLGADGLRQTLQRFQKWTPAWIAALFLLGPLLYFSAWQIGKVAPIEKLARYERQKQYKGGVRHVFWPGKYGVGDPLALAEDLCAEQVPPNTVEWNYPAALRVLKLQDKDLPCYFDE